ncbi:MFS transporter [Actinosynnema sp. NPDC047251]|uniref:Putative membrane protein n=1 Tax=Saccharothrix espanaensis (strain ATCC 51144 / DSM 44229 / JCM 9112 / NBRC 15066 / NRRL 15764) TaxID=1179773 RepID=K0K1K2_SACES|nr:MFS transporter [Saccharothrix espanaensis]CCH30453.1 putative membrane protein [Saccharothrix espanaensis DSM 44229]
MTGPLRVPAFRRMWLAGFVSEIGDWVLVVALPVYVYQLTGSVGSTATTFVVALLPGLALSPLAGVLADRWDKRRLMLWVSLAQAAALLPLLTGNLVLVNVVMAVRAALAVLFEPAKNALLPELVGRDQVAAANGLVGLNANLARLLGASLGGLVLGWSGLTGVLVLDVASFLVAAALLVRPFGVTPGPSGGAPMWRAWLDGLREIKGPLRGMVAVVGLMAAGQGMFVVLFVVFVTERLGGGEAEVGLLRGIQAIGGLVGGAVVGLVARRVAAWPLLAWSLIAFSALAFVGWNGSYVTTAFTFYLAVFAACGAPGVMSGVGMMSVLQLHTSDAVRGRVLATFGSLYDGFQALGMVLAGALAVPLGLMALLDVQAGLYLVAGLSAVVIARRTSLELAGRSS